MLAKQFFRLDSEVQPTLLRLCEGKDVTPFGAFPHGTELTFLARVPRSLGAYAVIMRLTPDGGEPRDLPFSFQSTEFAQDTYTLTLQTDMLCAEEGALFFYELLFARGEQTLFSNSTDNVHFSLSATSARAFRLLIHRADFHTPAWFRSGTMYHIFLDRFCRGKGNVILRPDAKENPDWEHGIPQFAPKPGDPLDNNMFFGGNLWGVTEKLDTLAEMGITVLYLSPLFESASNHRYDTADYETVDPYLGGGTAFDRLVQEAHSRGIKVILDGVFNHTGDDSRYFNRCGRYPETGACQSKGSPYHAWYRFRDFPDDYACWWGIKIMPRLNHENPDCRRYFTGEDGIAARWLRQGADGWRLDVADELPDAFLDEFRKTVKQVSGGEALIIGEVWENAADKIAYGKRRRYLLGNQLDSVMNYPFRSAVLEMLLHGDTEFFVRTLTEIYASYPREVSDSLMNLLGTHDTPRILTVLGDEGAGEGRSNAELSTLRLTPAQRSRAVRLLKIATVLQFTVYGVPSVYYGDEAGSEGYRDPFCRMPYPWGRENQELLRHYRMLGKLRKSHEAFHGGSFRFLTHTPGSFLFEREQNGDRVLVAVNLGDRPRTFPTSGGWIDCISQGALRGDLILPPEVCAVLIKR